MTRTVFPQRQCVHVWAQQTQDKGKAAENRIFFEGKTIYSYGYHFPMAVFLDADTVLINSDSYSSSTSSHQSYVRQAVNHKHRLYASKELVKAFSDYTAVKLNATIKDVIIKDAMAQSTQHLNAALKRRKASKIEDDLNSAIYAIQKAFDIFSHFKQKYPKELTKRFHDLTQNRITAVLKYGHVLEQERKKEEKLKAKKEAENAQLINNHIQSWYENDKPLESDPLFSQAISAIQSSQDIYLRIARSGDEIETSKGARFPIEHGIKAFKFIRYCKDNNVVWDRDAKAIPLGNFKIDCIDMDGNVKAGCHFVKWQEIERLATILKIYP